MNFSDPHGLRRMSDKLDYEDMESYEDMIWVNKVLKEIYDASDYTVKHQSQSFKDTRDDIYDTINFSTGNGGLVTPIIIRRTGQKMPSSEDVHKQFIKDVALRIEFETKMTNNFSNYTDRIMRNVGNFVYEIGSRPDWHPSKRGCDY